MKPGEYFLESGADRGQRGPQDRASVVVRQHRRPARPGRQPLSLLRSEQRARFRSRSRLRHAPEYSRRHVRYDSSRARRRKSRWWNSPARALVLGHNGQVQRSLGEANEPRDSPPHLRRSLRPNHGRSRASGRYRADRRSREGLRRLRRRDHLRRRQGDSRRHGPELHAPLAKASTARSTW